MQGISLDEQRSLLLSVGTHRANRVLSPLEVAVLLKKAVDAGTTRKQCADALNVGLTQISTFLKLLDLVPDIQHLADWRGSANATVPFSSMAEVARLEGKDQEQAAHGILRYGLNWKEVVQLVQIVARSGRPVSECVKTVLALRPEIQIRHLFLGEISSEDLQNFLKKRSQQERDTLFDRVLGSFLGKTGLIDGRLNYANFTIVSSQDLPGLLGVGADDLEAEINEMLARMRK